MGSLPGRARERSAALLAGLGFLERYALGDACWAECAPDVQYMFLHLATRSSEGEFNVRAAAAARQAARRWLRQHPRLPRGTPATLALWWYAYGTYTPTKLGLDTRAMRRDLRAAARGWTARDLFGFDPRREPPPDDLRDGCGCDAPPGTARRCPGCGQVRARCSRHELWLSALVGAHIASEVGLDIGCTTGDAARWLPAMRPYPRPRRVCSVRCDMAFYAVTHLVYVLCDYSLARLPPRHFLPEVAFVKACCRRAIGAADVEMLGESVDVLLALDEDPGGPLVTGARQRLLELQNRDGSWGARGDEPYVRFHKTWTALDGLTHYGARPLARLPDALTGPRAARSGC